MPKKASRPRDEPRYLEPPTPSYNIARILALKSKIQRACRPLVGQTLGKETFPQLVSLIHGSFPSKGRDIDEDVIIKSVQGLAASKLTREKLADTAWRLAGNLQHLRSCCAVVPWGKQVEPEWVPIQALSATLRWTRKKKMGASFRLKFLAGSPCPLTINQFWTHGFCAMFAQDLGFTAPWNNMPYADPRQLVSLRFYVKIEPDLCEGNPGFHEVKAPPGCLTWNKNLLAMRYRLHPEVFNCPVGYPPEHPCHSCYVGEDNCDAAVHAKTFIQRHCSRCRKDDAWFDPASRRRICTDCFHELRRKGEL
jgi:hypothetical protein